MEPDIVGREGKPFEMQIELGKIREFARATRSSHPAYLTDDHPVSPPTFLMNYVFWSDPDQSELGDVKLNLAQILHGGQEFVFHGPPPRAGTTLVCQARIDKVYEKEGRRGGTMTFIESVMEFRDQHGTLVAETRSTLIETSKSATA